MAMRDDNIRIIVKDQHNGTSYFQMDKSLPLRKLLVAYCNKKRVDFRTVTFLLNGSRVLLNKTPAELNLENNADIDVMSIMTGGGCASCNQTVNV